MKTKIQNATSSHDLDKLGVAISFSDLENKNELYDLIEEQRKQLNDVMAELSEMTLADVLGDADYE